MPMADSSSTQTSPFAESMERLDQVVRSVKMQQIAQHQGPVQIASNRMNAISPDEAWARQFSNQCIGPVCFGPAPKMDMPLPLSNVTQSFSADRRTAYSRPTAEKITAIPTPIASNGPMGIQIGRQKHRRSVWKWLAGRRQ
jgi:hypothetical protein